MGNPKLAKLLRCTGLALLVLGILAFVPASAQAALHGMGILKGCSGSTNCNENADCDNALFCDGAETCSTPSANQPHVSCTIEVTNSDGFDDSFTLRTACDRIKPGALDEFTDCTIQVTQVTDNGTAGDTTCAVGQVIGNDLLANNCVIGHDDVVQFSSVSYLIQADDPAPLPDQATVQETDDCNGTPDPNQGCNPGQVNNLQGSSQTVLTDNCVPGTPPCPEDSNLCTTITCNETTDGCDVATPNCDDGDLCTADSCNPATGLCEHGAPPSCDDGDLCTADSCNPATGLCEHGAPPSCDDGDLCTADSCNPATGLCEHGAPPSCDDQSSCTDDSCNPATGLCEHVDNNTCNLSEICRTPGFWGTHGGTEKVGHSTDITGTLLNAYNAANPGDPLNICGRDITNTTCGSNESALEAICVSPKGDSRLQLARQLTSAALNCIITKAGDGDVCTSLAGAVCGGVSISAVFDACNSACPTGTTALVDLDNDPLTPDVEVSCIGVIDCFNNGNTIDPTDGHCDENTGASCHDRNLDNGCGALSFVPPGAAGSPGECNDSRKNGVTIFTASGACK